jgi:hypothetical protein
MLEPKTPKLGAARFPVVAPRLVEQSGNELLLHRGQIVHTGDRW